MTVRVLFVCPIQVEVLNLYCDPKDSKSQQNLSQDVDKDDLEEDDNENVKLYTIPDKEYSRPYTGKRAF